MIFKNDMQNAIGLVSQILLSESLDDTIKMEFKKIIQQLVALSEHKIPDGNGETSSLLAI